VIVRQTPFVVVSLQMVVLLLMFLCRSQAILCAEDALKIGVLYSQTGPLAVYEKPCIDSALLAIEELNAGGGVMGKKIVAIVRDGKSDADTFAKEAENLIMHDGVLALFGAWTTPCRKAVKSVVEKYHSLLFYAATFEGLEESPNIIYTGLIPNQQVVPSLDWMMENHGSSVFLVGSDMLFSKATHAIAKEHIARSNGKILGDEYVPLKSANYQSVIDKMVSAVAIGKSMVILISLWDDENLKFLKLLKGHNTLAKVPILSLSLDELMINSLGREPFDGVYLTRSYFQGVERRRNDQFVQHFMQVYGEKSIISDAMEATYYSIYLWALAVKDAQKSDPQTVHKFVTYKNLEAPEGVVFVDGSNYYTWKVVRIGEIKNDGSLFILWSSQKPLRPDPFPIYKSRSQWEKL
jgi:urea transport system substrate-binding protein